MGWKYRGEDPPDYARMRHRWMSHHARFLRYVESHGLLCQDCRGSGGERDVILDDGTGPWEPCGWCEGTGKIPRWTRGAWLRWKADKYRKAKEKAAKKRSAA